jgi:hypothetical protein
MARMPSRALGQRSEFPHLDMLKSLSLGEFAQYLESFFEFPEIRSSFLSDYPIKPERTVLTIC